MPPQQAWAAAECWASGTVETGKPGRGRPVVSGPALSAEVGRICSCNDAGDC